MLNPLQSVLFYFKKVFLSKILMFFLFIVLSCATEKQDCYQLEKIITIENPVSFKTGKNNNFKMLILGDIHGYDTENLVDDNKAWIKYLKKIHKPFDSSFANTKQILSEAAFSDADFIVLPGDLTINGEKKSHELLASISADFENTDKKLFIVPGNHDINNPKALQFLKNRGKYAESVSDSEFSSIYEDFGYSEAVSRDENSLSYTAEPLPGVLLICLDTTAWQKNTFFPFRWTEADGRIKRKTLLWINGILERNKKEWKTVIIIQHHPLSEPVFPSEKTLPSSEKIRELYRKYNVSLVISAHRHVYYIDTYDKVPQITAPNISASPSNLLEVTFKHGEITVKINPYNFKN